MKVRSVVFVIPLIIIFALIGTGAGCSESDSSNMNEMMKDIPEGVSPFAYCDLKAFRGDIDLEDLYNDIRGDYLTQSGIYNIDFRDVNYLADCWNKELVIFRGEFDLDDIRSAVKDDIDYIAINFMEEEVWLDSSKSTMVALLKDTVAIGDKDDVEEYIKVRKGEANSLLDSEVTRDIMDRLPDGIATYYSEGTALGSQALATSYQKKDGNTISVTNVFKYADTIKAEEAKDAIEELFTKTTDYKDINVKSDGEFIILTGQLDVSDMVQG